MSAVFHKVRRRLNDESGVAGLVIASIIAIVAFSALSVFLNNFVGAQTLNKIQTTSQAEKKIEAAIFGYYLSQSTPTLPCPDTSVPPDGVADTCNAGSATAGTVPWVTLGLNQNDVIDGYNMYFRYAVSTVAKGMCQSQGNDFDSSVTPEYSGQPIKATDLSLEDANGIPQPVPFAVISVGANRRGGIQSNGKTYGLTPQNTDETANASAAPTTIHKSAYSSADGTAHFDDEVFAPTYKKVKTACTSLGNGNIFIKEPFDTGSTTLDSITFNTTGSTNPPTEIADPRPNKGLNRVGNFTDGTSYLATSATRYDFNPLARSLYITTLWTPDPLDTGVTTAGFSIATRATLADLTASSDIFSANGQSGITFRFDNRTANNISDAGVTNNITIRDQNAGALATSADTYKLINAKTYRLEVYDNGAIVWMRITQTDDSTNTATVMVANATDINGTENRVFFINGPARSILDDIIIGPAMLALENGSTTGGLSGTGHEGLAASAASNVNGTTTGNLTLEAWIRPKVLPTAGQRATIISQWDTNAAAAAASQSFWLYLDGDHDGAIAFSAGVTTATVGAIENYRSLVIPTVDEWTHVAVTFDKVNKDVRLIVNDVYVASSTSSSDANVGINVAAHRFAVGASLDSDTTTTNVFNGDISDVRVWDVERTSDQIYDNFEARLGAAGAIANLVVNWKLDREGGGLTSTSAKANPIGTDGVLAGTARYIPAQEIYFRPTSTSFCPLGTRVGLYQCDFRSIVAAGDSFSLTIPSNLTAVFARVWGGGGGGYSVSGRSSAGGGGGYSRGFVESIQSAGLTSIAGATLNVHAGGYGTGSGSTSKSAAGGGGGSGIFNSLNTFSAIVAGGGGGASYSDFNVSLGGDCGTVTGTTNQCGLGGRGGGLGSATALRAPDASSNCGGRGGDASPTSGGSPPVNGSGDCDDGGGDPSGRLGGPTSGTHTGGAGGGPSGILAGGSGYNADDADGNGSGNAIGGGGGGGGAIGGEAGGYDDNGTRKGFGGGGGSGASDAGVSNTSGSLGSFSFTSAITNDTTRYGSYTSSSKTVTINTTLGADLTASPVPSAGCTVDSLQIGTGNSNMIASIDSATQLTLVNFPTGTRSDRQLTINCSSGITSSAGGSTDIYYSPSYLGSSYVNPGAGGGTSSVNGHSGAVVIIW